MRYWRKWKMQKVTQYNKAYAATLGSVVTGLLLWANGYYGLNIEQSLVLAVGALITGGITYLMPNLPANG